MNDVPCGNLVEHHKGGSCILEDREFPGDCRECSAYVCGINEQERERGKAWSKTKMRRVQFLEGEGHD